MDEGACWGLLSELYWALEEEPLLCPALESLGVEIWSGDPDDFRLPPASESQVVPRMVAARIRAGKPLRRLALQPHLERGSLESPEMVVRFGAALAMIRWDVDVELVRDAESVVCPFKMSDMWKVDGAFEEDWQLLDDERPRYNIPWL